MFKSRRKMQPLLTLYDTGNIQRKLLICYRRFQSQSKNAFQRMCSRRGEGVCLSACWDRPPQGVGLETPLTRSPSTSSWGVGLEIPPWPDPPQLPPWVWPCAKILPCPKLRLRAVITIYSISRSLSQCIN